MVYDSLPCAEGLSLRTKEHIASICFSEDSNISVTTVDVQKQRGKADCGLFAVAFATSLCAGDDPSTLCYIQNELRRHLLSCFEQQSISLFPTRKRKRHPCPSQISTFPIYCICRMPEDNSRMVECVVCKEWFHEDCISAPRKVWTDKEYQWKCTKCCN